MNKPTEPKVKKPSLPRRPREPKQYGHEDWVGELWFGHTKDQTHECKTGSSMYSCCLGEKDIVTDIPGGKLRVSIKDGTIHRAILRPEYDNEMIAYRRKLQGWAEKVKLRQPEMDKYDAVMAEYEVILLEWKKQQAEEKLTKAMDKLKG